MLFEKALACAQELDDKLSIGLSYYCLANLFDLHDTAKKVFTEEANAIRDRLEVSYDLAFFPLPYLVERAKGKGPRIQHMRTQAFSRIRDVTETS